MALHVALVEDDPHLGATLSALVDEAEDMRCDAHYPSGEAALAGLSARVPDAVLMDINLPGMSGIECAGKLKQLLPQVHIVMLTAFDDSDYVFESLKAGATGYVLKRAPATEILDAIREVCDGGAPMSGAIARKVVGYFSRSREAPEVSMLTERERAVLRGLSQGQQYKEIADALNITINTVRKHIRGIYETLQVHTRSDAVKKLGGHV